MKAPRRLNAQNIGPWAMLTLLVRFRKGEGAPALALEYNVSKNTIWRWHNKFADDVDSFNIALASGYMQRDLEELLKALDTTKAQVIRQHAVLQRIMRPGQRYLPNQRGAPDELRPRRKVTP